MPLVVFPSHFAKGLQISSMFFGPLRSGAPTVFGATGKELDSGEPVRVVSFEWPEAYSPSGATAAKELQHLNRLNADIQLGTGKPLYTSIAANESDPPDFQCKTDDGPRGVECTQLVLQDRLEAAARFGRLRGATVGGYRHRLRHLNGYVVYVALNPFGGQSDPFDLKTLASDLVAGLQRHDPTIAASLTKAPQQMPPSVVTVFQGGTISSWPLTSDPGTLYSGTMGFELALSYSSTITETEAWKGFSRVVQDNAHDAQGVDDLVVSAEAPTTDGLAYPSDAALAQAVLERAATASLTTRHIRNIYLHVWGTRGVFRLIPGQPGVETISGELPFGNG
jgi:hypothetical protein